MMKTTNPPASPARAALAAALALASLAAAVPAAAQRPVIDPVTDLDFADPESWAMAWFGSVTVLTGFGVPAPLDPGSLELGLEAGWVPSLSEDQRRVGFGGTKVEDLNRTDAIARPRLTVGLPAGLTLTGAWIPPVEIDDVESNLVALALGSELWAGNRSRGGVRVYGQTGTVEGPITCTAADAAGGDDPEANPSGCEQPSDDEMTLTYYGVELSAAYRAAGGAEPYLAAALNRFDNEFQVDAFTFGIHDRSLLLAEGTAWSVAAEGFYRFIINSQHGQRQKKATKLTLCDKHEKVHLSDAVCSLISVLVFQFTSKDTL